MGQFRVPYPREPEERRVLFEKVADLLSRHGEYEGTPEKGTFGGKTPFGRFAGTYQALGESGELEITLTEKPWLVSTHMVEHEVRKLIAPR